MRVGELCGRLDLGQETLCTDDRSEFSFQNLEGHVAVVALVVGQLDRGHPTLTNLTLDAVAAVEGSVQAGDGVGHSGSAWLRSRSWSRQAAPCR